MIAAMVRILFGFVLACLAGALTQVLFVITPADIYGLEGAPRWQRIAFASAITLSAATQSAVFSLPFVAVVVLFGVVRRVQGWAYYVFASLAVALLGFAALYVSESGGQPTIANGYAVAAFAFSGIIAGYVYWLVAGHQAGSFYREREDVLDYVAEEDTRRQHLTSRDYDRADRIVPAVSDPGVRKTH